MTDKPSDRAELMPCPFCGCEDVGLCGQDRDAMYVACDQCTATGSASERKDEAIAAWNTRAAAPEGAQAVAVVVENTIGVSIVWANPPSHGRPPVGTKLYTAPPSLGGEDVAENIRLAYIAGYMQGGYDYTNERLDGMDLRIEAEKRAERDGYGAARAIDAARAAEGGERG